MAMCLSKSSLSKKYKKKISTFTVETLKDEYNPQTKTYKAYSVEDDDVYIPIGQWRRFFSKFPYRVSDYPSFRNCHFKGELLISTEDIRNRDQDVVAKESLKLLHKNNTVLVSCFTGFGKCLAEGTEVLMYDGAKKKVEDIENGEYVMGDDSTPRLVCGVCEGTEEMFEIIPYKGESFCVNKSHILTLYAAQGRVTTRGKDGIFIVQWFDRGDINTRIFNSYNKARKLSFLLHKSYPSIIDVELKDYLKLSECSRSYLKCIQTDIHYPEISLDKEENPYLAGMRCSELSEIPRNYKINSKRIRMLFLEGLADSEYCYSPSKSNEFTFEETSDSCSQESGISNRFTIWRQISVNRNLEYLNYIQIRKIPHAEFFPSDYINFSILVNHL
jgi:hypothetical protein